MQCRRVVFTAMVCLASCCAIARAACDAPEHHRLDFWLGRWEVMSGEEKVAESVIERSPEACAIAEHYRQKDGYTGTSHSFYDAALKKWRQTWIDSSGAVGEFVGDAGEREMAFTGETHRTNGGRVMRRMTLTAQTGGSVRQHSLASTDEGVTWKPHYDFIYRRAASSPDEAAIRELEAASWVAWKSRDGEFFERFLSDDHVEVHAYGISGKKAVVEGVRSPACEVRSYSLGPLSLTHVSVDVILVTYKAEQDSSCGGRKVPSPVWATSLYSRRDGRWVNVMYQHTALPPG
jgi:hypothetical protein